jgi:hypothetical protein
MLALALIYVEPALNHFYGSNAISALVPTKDQQKHICAVL